MIIVTTKEKCKVAHNTHIHQNETKMLSLYFVLFINRISKLILS